MKKSKEVLALMELKTVTSDNITTNLGLQLIKNLKTKTKTKTKQNLQFHL